MLHYYFRVLCFCLLVSYHIHVEKHHPIITHISFPFPSLPLPFFTSSMLILEKSDPALLAAVTRIITGANVVPFTIVRDYDEVEYYVTVKLKGASAKGGEAKSQNHVDAAALGNNSSTAADAAAAEEGSIYQPADVIVGVKHSVPYALLNSLGNFEEGIRDVCPKAYHAYLSGFGVTRRFALNTSTNSADGVANSEETPVQLAVEVTIPASVPYQKLQNVIEQCCAQLRTWCYYPLFSAQMERYQLKPESVKALRLPYHAGGGEGLYMYPSAASAGGSSGGGSAGSSNFIVTVVMRAESKDEVTFLRHFLQTFVDAKKLQRELSAAPGFIFSQGQRPFDAPATLSFPEDGNQSYFFCSFQIFRMQMETKERILTTVQQLINFRTFVWYHIHACRSHMHGLMRARVNSSLQVLNRAKTNTTGKARIKLEY